MSKSVSIEEFIRGDSELLEEARFLLKKTYEIKNEKEIMEILGLIKKVLLFVEKDIKFLNQSIIDHFKNTKKSP